MELLLNEGEEVIFHSETENRVFKGKANFILTNMRFSILEKNSQQDFPLKKIVSVRLFRGTYYPFSTAEVLIAFASFFVGIFLSFGLAILSFFGLIIFLQIKKRDLLEVALPGKHGKYVLKGKREEMKELVRELNNRIG